MTTHLSRFTSELFTELREKRGLCYSSHPINMNALEAGYWGIYVASGIDKAAMAIETLKDIANKLIKNGLNKESFDTAKNIIAGKEMMNLQTNEDYINIHSLTTLYDYSLDFHYREMSAIEKMTYSNFQSQIKKILSRQWSDVHVGYETNLLG